MITILYKVKDEEVDTVGIMSPVWDREWLVKPTSIEVTVSPVLCDTEKEYLGKVMSWVYPFHDNHSVVLVNGTEYEVNKFREPIPEPLTVS